jgi:hypothetical protein
MAISAGAAVALLGACTFPIRFATPAEVAQATPPWAFGFTAVTALAWSAWIIAILIVVSLGTLHAPQNRRAMA